MVSLYGCSGDNWRCVTRGTAMFSLNDKDEIGSANKGCSCSEIRAWDKKILGEVDERRMRENFGC